MTADLIAWEVPPRAMIPSDLINGLSKTFKVLEEHTAY
jgi:hypothetical protein